MPAALGDGGNLCVKAFDVNTTLSSGVGSGAGWTTQQCHQQLHDLEIIMDTMVKCLEFE